MSFNVQCALVYTKHLRHVGIDVYTQSLHEVPPIPQEFNGEI
jgi:hypothetical protein